MTTRTASCSCGQLQVTCEGDPVRISMCHCLACQRRTGSIFGTQARFPSDKVKVTGKSTEYVRFGDSGGRISSRFCPTCGSTVCWEIDKLPGFVAVAVGAFADPNFGAPKVSVYNTRRHAWAVMPELHVENFD